MADDIRCRNCGRLIRGCIETVHGHGWVHVETRRERCKRPHVRGYRPQTRAKENPDDRLAVPDFEE